MQRLSLDVEVVAADVATWAPGRVFDVVLLDAPCSATGTVRRHPDLLRQKTMADIERLVPLQARLIDNAATLVKPGGVLVYSTCSLEPEEGTAQIAAFLARNGAFTRAAIDAAAIGADPAWMTAEGELRTLPFHLPLDGRLLRRTAAARGVRRAQGRPSPISTRRAQVSAASALGVGAVAG